MRRLIECAKWWRFHPSYRRTWPSPEHFLGAWHNKDTGELVLDVVVVKVDKRGAETLGRQNDQDAIWGIKEKKEFRLKSLTRSGAVGGWDRGTLGRNFQGQAGGGRLGRNRRLKSEYKFSSTQLNLTGEAALRVLDASHEIDDDDLGEDGREDQPHITLFYGLRDSDPSNLEEILQRGAQLPLSSAGSQSSTAKRVGRTMPSGYSALRKLDLGALFGGIVGESQARVRQAMKVIEAVGGDKGVFWIATSKDIRAIKPELKRRFKKGIWFFDLPDAAEKDAIWEIFFKKYPEVDRTQRKAVNDSGYHGASTRRQRLMGPRTLSPTCEASASRQS